MNSTTPRRLPIVDDLVRNIALCAARMHDIQDQPDEINCSLAFCEVAVHLPPAWFTTAEQVVVFTMIQVLTGKHPKEFIMEVHDGSLSYYNKCRSQGEKDITAVVELIAKSHAAAFPD